MADTSTGRDCAALTTIVPAITTVFGSAMPSRMRAAGIRQSQTATLKIQITDPNGDPIDLSTCGTLSVKGRFREVVNPSLSSANVQEVTGAFSAAPVGYVEFAVPECVSATAGIYYAEAGVFAVDSDNVVGDLKSSNTVYLFVEPTLFGGSLGRAMFPLPTIQEARLRLRDSGPEENLLLRDYEFDLAELCDALCWCVNYWNFAQPPIDVYYNSINYPFYHHAGYTYKLLESAALRYMRNHLPYQAAGVSVDDQDKLRPYMEMSKMLREEYQTFVRNKKVSTNMEMAMGSFGSPYGWYRSY